VWVASFLFLATCVCWQPVAGVVWALDGAWRAACLALQVAGGAIGLAAIRRLDAADLSGVRQVRAAMHGGRVRPHTGTNVITRQGPYGLVRHPIYSAWLLMTLPAPLMTGGRLVFALVSAFYLMVAVPFEERSLAAEHGDAYLAYRHEVRWRVIPWLY
jgi:protein-S-isoprenylcysteine O-methyltransferase Ste14